MLVLTHLFQVVCFQHMSIQNQDYNTFVTVSTLNLSIIVPAPAASAGSKRSLKSESWQLIRTTKKGHRRANLPQRCCLNLWEGNKNARRCEKGLLLAPCWHLLLQSLCKGWNRNLLGRNDTRGNHVRSLGSKQPNPGRLVNILELFSTGAFGQSSCRSWTWWIHNGKATASKLFFPHPLLNRTSQKEIPAHTSHRFFGWNIGHVGACNGHDHVLPMPAELKTELPNQWPINSEFTPKPLWYANVTFLETNILLMEEILHHLGWLKPYK